MYFGGQKPENDFIKIYQIDKENSIYSMFTENDYIDEKNNKMDLAEALEKGVISSGACSARSSGVSSL